MSLNNQFQKAANFLKRIGTVALAASLDIGTAPVRRGIHDARSSFQRENGSFKKAAEAVVGNLILPIVGATGTMMASGNSKAGLLWLTATGFTVFAGALGKTVDRKNGAKALDAPFERFPRLAKSLPIKLNS